MDFAGGGIFILLIVGFVILFLIEEGGKETTRTDQTYRIPGVSEPTRLSVTENTRATHAQNIWCEWLTSCGRDIRGISWDVDRAAHHPVDLEDVVHINRDDSAEQIRSAMELVTCGICQRSQTVARRLEELEVRTPPQSRVRRRECERQDSGRAATPDKTHVTAHYFVNTYPHLHSEEDIYGIHKDFCRYVPATDRRISLGQFNDCHGAVKEAEIRGYLVYACYYCCRDCYKPTLSD